MPKTVIDHTGRVWAVGDKIETPVELTAVQWAIQKTGVWGPFTIQGWPIWIQEITSSWRAYCSSLSYKYPLTILDLPEQPDTTPKPLEGTPEEIFQQAREADEFWLMWPEYIRKSQNPDLCDRQSDEGWTVMRLIELDYCIRWGGKVYLEEPQEGV